MPEEKKAPVQSGGGSNDRTMAILAHVLGIFISFIGPLIIYLTQQKEGYVKGQSKEALNFQLTILIGYVVCWILMFVLIGAVLVWIVGIINLIFCIIAAMAASRGEDYKYPFAIKFIK